MADLAELKADTSEALANSKAVVAALKEVKASNDEQKTLIADLKQKLEDGTLGQEDIDELDAMVDEQNAVLKGALSPSPSDVAVGTTSEEAATDGSTSTEGNTSTGEQE